MRKVPEWKGKDDDAAIPVRVKVRRFKHFNGRCANCDLPIVGKLRPAYDHVVPLILGGENRENNIQLLCVPCHGLKTKQDVADKSTAYKKRTKAIGIRKPSSFRGWRKMDGTVVFNNKR